MILFHMIKMNVLHFMCTSNGFSSLSFQFMEKSQQLVPKALLPLKYHVGVAP